MASPSPPLELLPVPIGAELAVAVAVVEELELARRGEDGRVQAEVQPQPARGALLRADDEERRKRGPRVV